MIYQVKYKKGFCDEGVIYTNKVVARKLNGYIVSRNGEECFVQNDDISIISISQEELDTPIKW